MAGTLLVASAGLTGCGGLYTDKTYARYFANGGSVDNPGPRRQDSFALERVYTRSINEVGFITGPGPNFSALSLAFTSPTSDPYNTPGNSTTYAFSNNPTIASFYAEIVFAFTVNPLAPFTGTTGLRLTGEAAGGSLSTNCQNSAFNPTSGGGYTLKFWLNQFGSYSTAQASSGTLAFTPFDFSSGGTFDPAAHVYTEASSGRQYFLVSLRSNTPPTPSSICSGVSIKSIQLTAVP
jgi:hypothetical protein